MYRAESIHCSKSSAEILDEFQRSILAAAEKQWDSIHDLCMPSTVRFVEKISEWVSDGGIEMELDDVLSASYLSYTEVDMEDKPLFLLCVNMATVMPDEMATDFMEAATRKYCRAHTIGKKDVLNHMNNFAVIFHRFGPSVIFLVYWKLLHEKIEVTEKVNSYLTHVYHGDISQICHNVNTYETSKTNYDLLESAVRLMDVGAFSESSSLHVASTILTRMLRGGGPVTGPCLLAATSNTNFNEINMAVLSGRIDMNSPSTFLDTSERPFLAYLGHLKDANFMTVITSWLPLIKYDVITGTAKALADKMLYDGSLILDPVIRSMSLNYNDYWTPRKWSILMRKADRNTSFNSNVALASIYFGDPDILQNILEGTKYTPQELKNIATYAADKPWALSVLTRRYSWLARVPVTPCGLPILHYAISHSLSNSNSLLQVKAIRNNLDVMDSDGKTPLMACCEGLGNFRYFQDLLKAGSRVNIMTSNDETIFHLLSTNRNGRKYLNHLLSFRVFGRMIETPDVEVRRQPDNMTALQLALSKNNYGVATSLMLRLDASASSLYGKFSSISTAEMMLLNLNTEALKLIRECAGIVPSLIRILYEHLEGGLDLPGSRFRMWPAFMEPRRVLNSHYKFPLHKALSVNLILTYMKQFGLCEYAANSTRAEAIDSGIDVSDLRCAICLECMDDHLRTSCSHRFHPKCLSTWLAKNDTCPMCRSKDIETSSFTLQDGPDAPRLNERPISQPLRLPPPYDVRHNDSVVEICQDALGVTHIVYVEYNIGGKWTCECKV
nr:MAG: wsv199-like protein [Marsupenaeus japonicus pemonivirus]